MPPNCTHIILTCIRHDSGALLCTIARYMTCSLMCWDVERDDSPAYLTYEKRRRESVPSRRVVEVIDAGDGARLCEPPSRRATVDGVSPASARRAASDTYDLAWPYRPLRRLLSHSTRVLYGSWDLTAARAARVAHILSMLSGQEASWPQRTEGASARQVRVATPTFIVYTPPGRLYAPACQFLRLDEPVRVRADPDGRMGRSRRFPGACVWGGKGV